MIIVNTDKQSYIRGSYNGTNFRIPYDEGLFMHLKEIEKSANSAQTHPEYLDAISLFHEAVTSFTYREYISETYPNIIYKEATGKYHLKINDYVSEVHIPDVLMDIIHSSEGMEEPMPIIKMCMRFLLNPIPSQERFDMLANYVTQTWTDGEEIERLMEEQGLAYEVAKEMATYSDLQVTQEGYLKTSKVVDEITEKWSLKLDSEGKPELDEYGTPIKIRVPMYSKSFTIDEETGEVEEITQFPEYAEDRKFEPAIYKRGDNFTSGGVLGYKYEIGKLAQLPDWSMVSMLDEEFHQKGLHIGGLRYVQGYLRGNRILLDVFVCPSQIGKFTDEGLGEMTCKEFFIYGSAHLGSNMRGMYHTSTYTKLSGTSLEERFEALVNIKDMLEEEPNSLETAITLIKDVQSFCE